MGTGESDGELVLSRNSGLWMGAEEKLAGSDWVEASESADEVESVVGQQVFRTGM